jgi:hypothetical protein
LHWFYGKPIVRIVAEPGAKSDDSNELFLSDLKKRFSEEFGAAVQIESIVRKAD